MSDKQTYCVKEKKKTGNNNIHYTTSSNGRKVMLSKCSSCGSKKSTFV